MSTLLLIDASSLIYRSFHALPPLNAPDGRPSNALYGVSSILLKLWREGKPDYATALFDRPEPTFRKKEYEAYKAQRAAPPPELIVQLQGARVLFNHFGIKTFEEPGIEADDLIASMAEKFRGMPGLTIIILTGDLDTLQLVEGGKVIVRTFRKGLTDTFVYDEAAIRERYGLRPDQMTDYKALVGDASDNIKGVPGIGPKTAAELLRTFGTLDEFLKRAHEAPKLQARVLPHRDTLLFSRRLVTLKRDAVLDVGSLEDLALPEDHSQELNNYFLALGFDSLVKRMNTPAEIKSSAEGGSLPAGFGRRGASGGKISNLKTVSEGKSRKSNLKTPSRDTQKSLFGT